MKTKRRILSVIMTVLMCLSISICSISSVSAAERPKAIRPLILIRIIMAIRRIHQILSMTLLMTMIIHRQAMTGQKTPPVMQTLQPTKPW